MTNQERVQQAALEVLAEHSKGIHYTPLPGQGEGEASGGAAELESRS